MAPTPADFHIAKGPTNLAHHRAKGLRDVDRAMRAARETTVVAARRARYAKIALFLRDLAPVVPIV